MTRHARVLVRLWMAVMVVAGLSAVARAQNAPAAAARPDDTPSVKIGGVLFTDFTYTKSPESTDSDGHPFNPSQFNVGRTYINITGNLNHIVNFRFTPDIARESGAGSGLFVPV